MVTNSRGFYFKVIKNEKSGLSCFDEVFFVEFCVSILKSINKIIKCYFVLQLLKL